jgi:hypothetical protein
MINIDNRDYTIDEIQQVFDLCRDLLRDNETMRANVIAMSAKLDNEEKKVKGLKQQLALMALNNYSNHGNTRN